MSYLAELEKKWIEASGTIKRLEERIRDLEAALAQLTNAPKVPLVLKLTPCETRALEVLLRRHSASKEQLLAEMYAHRYHGDDLPEIKIVDVFICKLRRKLAPHGIKIETRWGAGYTLPMESRVALDHMRRKELDGVVQASVAA